MSNTSLKWATLLLSSTLVLSACGSGDTENKSNDKQDTEQKSKSSKSESNTNSSNAIAWKDVKVSPEDAVKVAQDKQKGDLHDLSFEKEQGKWVYKVELMKGKEEHKFSIDANNKKVVSENKEKENDASSTFKLSDAKKFEDALKAAQDKEKGDVKEWSLSKDDGKLVYGIELQKGNKQSTEFDIDAKSLEILQQEKD